MEDAVILLVIFSVPLSAILGAYFLKYKRMQLEAGKGGGGDVEARLRQLEKANADLLERVGTLETIAIDADTRSAGIAGAHKLKELESSVHEERAVLAPKER